ncbi:MAG: hypothetical protein ABI846_09650 [Rudaea sp.]
MDAATIAGTYDVLVCPQEECAFDHDVVIDYVGTLVLFPAVLGAAQLSTHDERAYVRAASSDRGANACFSLTQRSKAQNYIWATGLTTWARDGAVLHLSLGSGIDAGYSAQLRPVRDGLAGTGSRWGVGAAAPDDFHLQTIVARRRGQPDLRLCPTVSTAPDPEQVRRTDIHRRMAEIHAPYAARILATLRGSADPRYWAISTLFETRGAEHSRDRAARLERAMTHSQDPLVYWIALHDGHAYVETDANEDLAVRALPAIEPDNMAAWVEPLSAAMRRGDAPAVTRYLARMAAATRYDEHADSILKAMLDVYKRIPAPGEYVRTGQALIAHLDRETAPYYLAQFRGMDGAGTRLSAGLPGLQELFVACRAAREPIFDAVRLMLCAHIARTLTTRSTSFWQGLAGFDLLRQLDVYDAQDLALARRHRWLMEKFGTIAPSYVNNLDAAEVKRYIDDLVGIDSETTAMERLFARAGVPVEPPADWPLRVHPFIAERPSETARRVFGGFALWIAQVQAPPGETVIDAY